MIQKNWLDTFGLIFLGVLLFTGGFYFGFKSWQAQSKPQIITTTPQKSMTPSTEQLNITAKEVPGVYWIKTGHEPVCPPEYTVKGRFDTNGNVYYTKDAKTYSRIKPDICFASEDFARDQAGFIKKF